MKINLNNTQKKVLWVIGGITVAIILASKFIHSLPKPQPAVAEGMSQELDTNKVLKRGSKGIEVSELQRMLLKDYNANLGTSGINKNGIDGDFGLLTELALKKAKGVTQITLNEIS